MNEVSKPTSGPSDLDTWVWCGHCGAAAWGVPPHGEGNSCPLTVRRAEHEMNLREEVAAVDNAKTEAERRYWEKALDGSSLTDIFKKSLLR